MNGPRKAAIAALAISVFGLVASLGIQCFFLSGKNEPSKEAAEIIVMLEDENLEWTAQNSGLRNMLKLGKIEVDVSNKKVTVSGYELPIESSSDINRIIEAAKRRERSLLMGNVRKERREAQEAAVKKLKEELDTIKNRAKLEADLDAAKQRDEERKKRVSNEPLRFDAGELLVTMPNGVRPELPAVRMPLARDHDKEESQCLTTYGNGPLSSSPVVQVASYYYPFYERPRVSSFNSLFPPYQERRLGVFHAPQPSITRSLIGLGIR